MKRITILSIIFFHSYFICFGQSTITKIRYTDHRTNTTYQVFKINVMKAAANDGKYERALLQCDIIGNDFNGDQQVSKAVNKNSDGSHTQTDYILVDGYKRTFCGPATEYYYKDGRVDKDHCLNIEVDPRNPLLIANKNIFDRNGGNSGFYDPWNIVEGEINIHSSQRKFYGNPYSVPDTKLTSREHACIYGPWVVELKEGGLLASISDHENNNEIHPMEQLWWKAKPIDRNLVFYDMALFVDNSGRFNDKSDYKTFADENSFKPWSINPVEGNFAIAFEANADKRLRTKYIINVESNKYAGILNDDGKKHYLVYNNDTLIEVQEQTNQEIINIDFVNVGYDPNKLNGENQNTPIRGFIVIKCKIAGTENDYAGDLKLNVARKIVATERTGVKIILEKVRRLQLNSYAGINEFTGRPLTRFHPFPNIPVGFNEKKVNIDFRVGTTRFARVQIPSLEVGAEFTFNNVWLKWEGNIRDKATAFVNCSVPYLNSDFALGELIIGTDPLLVTEDHWRTTMPVQFSGMRNQDVYLFEFTFKVEAELKAITIPKTQ